MATPATKEDIADEELKLLGATRTLDIKPEGVETKEGFENFLNRYEDATKPKPHIVGKRQTSRISIFFGEEGKVEVNYKTWRYEFRCLIKERCYDEDILQFVIG
jgi:hypothetical protein